MPKVVHLNCHNNPKALMVAASKRAQIMSLNEVGRIQPKVHALPGYDHFVIRGNEVPQRTTFATNVVFREGMPIFGSLGMMGAGWSKPVKIAPERWIYGIAVYVEGGKYAHVSFHNHAVVDGRPDTVDRVKKHAEGVEQFGDTIMYLKRMGFAVSASGDFNTRDDARSPGWVDMGEMLRDMKWEYKDVGLDWMVHDPETLRRTSFDVILKEDSHSDHPGLFAGFRYV